MAENVNDEKNNKKTERIQEMLTAVGREVAKWVIYDKTVKLTFDVNISQGTIGNVDVNSKCGLIK